MKPSVRKTTKTRAPSNGFRCLWDDTDYQKKTRQKPRQKVFRV